MSAFRLSRLCPFSMPICCIFLALFAFFLLPSPFAVAQEGPQRYQLQIGSAKEIKGTKWFASKASRVLNQPAYVIHRGNYYVVLTGNYPNEEEASKKLMEFRQHYNGMVVSYDLEGIIAAYEQGIALNEDELLDMLLSGERKRKARQKKRETEPIREVKKDEASELRKIVQEGLRQVTLRGCTLTTSEELAGYLFTTKTALSDLDAYSLQTTEKHGHNLYIVLEAHKGQNKIVTEQSSGGKTGFTRNDASISLKLQTTDEDGVERIASALQELITFCSK